MKNQIPTIQYLRDLVKLPEDAMCHINNLENALSESLEIRKIALEDAAKECERIEKLLLKKRFGELASGAEQCAVAIRSLK